MSPPPFFYCHYSLIPLVVPPSARFFPSVFNLALRPLCSALICSQLGDADTLNDVKGRALCPVQRSGHDLTWLA